jgi:glucosamine-6-phosphate deaminase
MAIEQIPTRIFERDKDAAAAVAQRISEIIREKNSQGKKAVLGLATGHTPINVYRELIRLHNEEGLDFSNVITFNLDEYWPIDHSALQSYHTWMHEHFFKYINIAPENIHIPSGEWPESEIEKRCNEYEEKIDAAGGIDFQILGIGRSGHIGFNEPGSRRVSRTRRITLDKKTRLDAASDFFGEENVPEMAITMGVGTILKAREICLMAFGEKKAEIIYRAVEEPVSPSVSASFLQEHANTTFYLDTAASVKLTRIETPWELGPCTWDDRLHRRAVIHLALKLNKPILKLTDNDYLENGLLGLIRSRGGAYNVNLSVFRHLMSTITGWPGGKGEKKRVLIFSPHPDDDVICMGGSMIRFVEQGHETHVAYMVSGYISVFDHIVSRHADFVREFNKIFGLTPEHTASVEKHIDRFLRNKKPGEADSAEIREIKALVRKTEAVAAAKYCGLPEGKIHFLDMPFYDTGQVEKHNIGTEDITVVRKIIETIQPDMVFAAGDITDPHGTHRQCLDAVIAALDEYKKEGNQPPEVWLYRGAWQEWAPEEIGMAVPLSPDELYRKRSAIFRHESQKDRAMFPGPSDTREFWKRAEDRNIATADIYDTLGLPEYHAIEAFAKHLM